MRKLERTFARQYYQAVFHFMVYLNLADFIFNLLNSQEPPYYYNYMLILLVPL